MCGAGAIGPGRTRWSWGLIAAGTASWGIGQTVWSWYECVLHVDVPFPSLADVGYLGMPVLTAAGLLAIPLSAQSAANRARSVLDGLMVACGLLLISYMLLLDKLIGAGSDSLVGLVISLAYPVSDVVIVTIVLYIFARDRQRHSARMPLLLVGAGLVTFAISDSGFAYLTMIGAYTSGAVIDAGWFAGFLLLALAGARSLPKDEEAQESAAAGSLGIMLPYLVVLGVVAVGVVDMLRGPAVDVRLLGPVAAHPAHGRSAGPDHDREPGPHPQPRTPGRGTHRRAARERAAVRGAGAAQLGRRDRHRPRHGDHLPERIGYPGLRSRAGDAGRTAPDRPP